MSQDLGREDRTSATSLQVGLDASDSDLVVTAARAYAGSLGYEGVPPITWRAMGILKQDESVVVPIVATIGSHQDVRFFFKSFFSLDRPETELRDWQEAFRRGIVRDRIVTERFGRMAATEGLEIRKILASDPDRLSLVTLEVGGDPLGKAWRWLLRTDGRSKGMDYFGRVGRMVRLMEEASKGEPDSASFINPFKIELARRRLELFFGASMPRLQGRFEEAATAWAAVGGFELYYAHGDIDGKNVLIDGDRLGVIDCFWEPRPITFDMTRLLMRLRLEMPQVRAWSANLASAAMEGYGDRALRLKPEFTLLSSMKLLGLMQRFQAAGRWVSFRRTRRAVEELLES